MKIEELIAFAKARHGLMWVTPFAQETGYSASGVWRMVEEQKQVTKRMEREIARLRQSDQVTKGKKK